MNANLPPLIVAMTRPDFYPHRPHRVELKQTHISYVLIAQPFVYKVKKAIRFPFVDYSTLELRRYFCAEEIRLNRRLAPHAYLGVVGMSATDDGFALAEDGASPVVEYAVQMQYLPDEQMLSSRLASATVSETDVEMLARKTAWFHRHADRGKAGVYGSAQAIMAHLTDNFRDTRQFIGRSITPTCFDAIQKYSDDFVEDHRPLFQQRIADGRVCEGHGDLRAEHVCFVRDIEIFDCIEFDEALRYGDVASELAFLCMDLDFSGRSDLSITLQNSYQSAARDPALLTLLPFYKSYRAYVRGKVESLKSLEAQVSPFEQRQATIKASQYFYLAQRYANGPSSSKLIVVCGNVASGKSTVARILSARTGFAVLSSDIIRKTLLGLAPTERATAEYRAGAYSEAMSERVYAKLCADAMDILSGGHGVIVDATFADTEHRRRFIATARRLEVPALFVECRSDEATTRRRLEERQSDANTASDADWRIYQNIRARFVPFSSSTQDYYFPLETDERLMDGLTHLEKYLQ